MNARPMPIKKLEAPEKKFLLVKDAAHSPLWENPQSVVEFMRDIINE